MEERKTIAVAVIGNDQLDLSLFSKILVNNELLYWFSGKQNFNS